MEINAEIRGDAHDLRIEQEKRKKMDKKNEELGRSK